jgi:hypothetical protein
MRLHRSGALPWEDDPMSFTLALPRLSVSGDNAVNDVVASLAQQGVKKVLVLTDKIIRGLRCHRAESDHEDGRCRLWRLQAGEA